MRKLNSSTIDQWAGEIEKGADAFLDFAESVHINECYTQDGEKVVYIEDGVYYLARGFRMGENDGEKQRAIICELASCGLEFKKDY